MKTLDEVIEAFEYTYENDPIAWTYGVDALHYLKEYQEQRDQIDALPDYYDLVNFWAESQENPPLTWDELEQMEGKPIWVEDNNGWYKGWVVIEKFVEDDMFTTGFTYEKNNFGTLWQAYRKEKE